MMQIQCCIGF